MTVLQSDSKFCLSDNQWVSLCATLPDLRKFPTARSLLDDRITVFRACDRADSETNAPHTTNDKLKKIEAAAKKLRNELQSLDAREKISLARLAAPEHSPLLLDNMREFWGERSSLFEGLDQVEKTARRYAEAVSPKQSGVDAANRMLLVKMLDLDLKYFSVTLTSQGPSFDFACTVLMIADPKIKDGSRIVRKYLKDKKKQIAGNFASNLSVTKLPV